MNTLRERREAFVADVARSEVRVESLREDPTSIGVNPEQVDQILLQWEQEIKTNQNRVWRLDQRVIDLEKLVALRREDLGAWEKTVNEAFQ